ncbi:radical SAM/SPASM domain-containing protein [Bacteroides sp. 224]|uniref:radical SAM/SPASM domain-containing protein n=1 Tax=Bacteroides sp. 224 TaxID=2302936 RepID=UPI0013CFE96B|nr:radical SAM protein [Bacteroides sp. 224]
MIAKLHHNQLFTFEKTTGMSAVFSGNELALLQEYTQSGVVTPFIERLFHLGILAGNIIPILSNSFAAGEIHSPQSLHIDITNRCPLHCSICYKIPDKPKDITYLRWDELITEAAKLKVFQIAIGGGEPLTHPDIVAFVGRVAQTPMSVTITSSGWGLDENLLNQLIGAGLNHLQISLNGSTEAINRLSRDGYAHVIRALQLLSHTNGLSYGVNWVARKSNLADFEQLVALAKHYRAGNINILRYKPSLGEVYANEALNKDEFFLLVDKIKQVRGIQIKTDSAYSHLLLYLNNGKVSAHTCGCGAGRTFMAISPDGTMKPCSHLQVGSHSDSIAGYWNHSESLHAFRNLSYRDAPNHCGSCTFVHQCGGCRAICERAYHNHPAGETSCPVYKRKTT